MKRFQMAFIVVLCLIQVQSSPAQSKERLKPEQAKKVDQAVIAQIEKQGLVGVAIGILQKGEIVYLKGFGLADRESQIPVTVDTVFNWASNSKPLCALAAMQLVEKGKLDLDCDIKKYVPEFPEKDGIITMRHLLCHQSGIQHYGRVLPTNKKYDTPLPLLNPVNSLNVFNRTPLLHKPGEKFLYSSYAYILASAVVQNAGKQPIQDQLVQRIIKPLGMKSFQLDMPYQQQPYWAAGYNRATAEDKPTRLGDEAHYWKHGAGGYKSNIRDFAIWARAVLNQELISASTDSMMNTRQKTNDGKLTGHGLGFGVDDQNGLRLSHGGKQGETTTRLVVYPKQKHGVVVMTNCGYGDPAAISTAIYQALRDK
ncbi:MAG: beta-lactamase family protein [Planctomycetia bacterium]|nr:beta-lactamase family protein [Planctomycetia bacterium]